MQCPYMKHYYKDIVYTLLLFNQEIFDKIVNLFFICSKKKKKKKFIKAAYGNLTYIII